MSHLLDSTGTIDVQPLQETSVLDGSPRAGSRTLAAVAGAKVGVWEMTAGTATDIEIDEVFVVVAGSATVAFEDKTVLALTPGSVVRLQAGDRTTWTVHETLRKIYIV
jgi:uncharacterized cupin superfamily protein